MVISYKTLVLHFIEKIPLVMHSIAPIFSIKCFANAAGYQAQGMFGPFWEVEMSKKCTPLWREAHFEVKSANKLKGTEHFWTFRCDSAWQA